MDEEVILREKLEESKQKAIRLVAAANRPAIEQMIRAFEQNTKFTSLVDVVDDPDGYVFMNALIKFCSKEIITRVGLNLPDGLNAREVNLFTVGFFGGVFLAELGKAKLILRQG